MHILTHRCAGYAYQHSDDIRGEECFMFTNVWLVVITLIILGLVLPKIKHRGTCILLLLFFGCLFSLFYVVEKSEVEVVDMSDCLKTVAHIDLSNRDDLELIAVDYENDVAYYSYVKPERHVNVGDTVYLFDGIEASLVSVDAVGFTFTCDVDLAAGLSGTAVLNINGEQIGYISRRLSTGDYYAVWS